MKQTQTKLFDFSDVGLDFSAGSKNLFPDRFKKMLSQGYNTQTVSSVAVVGNQVTLTYGVSHGYVADRVLKVDSGTLAAISGGEFWIDSVTTNTVKFTLDGAPTSIAGGFTTKVASLGWSLVYEQSNIQVYKFKQLDESDVYLRVCFQNQGARRNCLSPCIGKSFDQATGFITDTNSLAINKEIMVPDNGFKWEFQVHASATYNNYTYAQGYSTYGKGQVVGSIYHLAFLSNTGPSAGYGSINAILPIFTHDYASLTYPIMIGATYGSITSGNNGTTLTDAQAFIASTPVVFQVTTTTTGAASYIDAYPQAINSFLPTALEGFNTTTAESIPLYIRNNGQFLGMVAGGAYRLKYAATNAPSITPTASPSSTSDIDLNSNILVHSLSGGSSAQYAVFYAFPIEEIKIA